MNKQELFEQIVSHFEEFEAHHSGTTKVSQRRARAAIGSIKKLITPYKKANMEATKS